MTTQTGFKQDVTGSYIDKDPAAILIYTMDWSQWISPGDAIASSTFAVSTIAGASNVVIETSSVQTADHRALVELSGGTAGSTYIVTNTITTENGAVDARRFKLKVVDRFA
jgi:hypothetical protein